MESRLCKKEIYDLISSLGERPPKGWKNEDLLLYYHGLVCMAEENIPSVVIKKDLSLNYIPTYANKNLPWKEHLRIHGWAVVSCLSLEESHRAREGILDYLHKICPTFDPEDKSTWLKKNIPYAPRGVIKNYVGHIEPLWRIRELALPIFQEFWGEKDLLVSFDGLCLLGRDEKQKSWMHVDQKRTLPEFAALQGVVNLLPNGPENGGTILLQGSHEKFSEYMKAHPTEGIPFYCHIDAQDPLFIDCPVVKPCLEEGEMLLFDSRVVHCNTPPDSDLSFRLCTYVSMAPRRLASKKDLQRRIKIAEEGRMTGHWTHGEGLTLCPKDPHFRYSKGFPKVKEVEKAEFTSIRRRMIGY